MVLRSVRRVEEPGYPRKCAPVSARLGRIIAVLGMGAASAGLLGGCAAARGQAAGRGEGVPAAVEAGGRAKEAGRTAGRDRHVARCEPEPRLAGQRILAEHFTCAPALSPSMRVWPGPPGVTDVRLCDGSPSWARFDIPRPMRASLLLGGDQVSLDLLAPDGGTAARLGPGAECVALDLEPGVWVLRATPSPTRGPGVQLVELWFEEVRATP